MAFDLPDLKNVHLLGIGQFEERIATNVEQRKRCERRLNDNFDYLLHLRSSFVPRPCDPPSNDLSTF